MQLRRNDGEDDVQNIPLSAMPCHCSRGSEATNCKYNELRRRTGLFDVMRISIGTRRALECWCMLTCTSLSTATTPDAGLFADGIWQGDLQGVI